MWNGRPVVQEGGDTDITEIAAGTSILFVRWIRQGISRAEVQRAQICYYRSKVGLIVAIWAVRKPGSMGEKELFETRASG